MSAISVLIPVAVAAVAIVLLVGVGSMLKGGEFNRKYSNILMRWRIGLQALAVALIMLGMYLGGR